MWWLARYGTKRQRRPQPRVTKLRHERADRVSNPRPRGLERYGRIPRSTSQAPAKVFNVRSQLTVYVPQQLNYQYRSRYRNPADHRHGAVTGASHPRGRLTGLAQHAGETAVAPLMVHRPQVRAGLIEAMHPSAAVCRAAASGAGGVACIGVITAGHACVSNLFCALCAASAAAFPRFLCANDLLWRAISLITVVLVAGSVLGEGWCAELARAGQA